jgi:hypothetical protein
VLPKLAPDRADAHISAAQRAPSILKALPVPPVPGKRRPLAAVALSSSSASASASASAFSSSASVAGSGAGSLAGRRSLVSNGLGSVGGGGSGIHQRHRRRLPPGANVAGAAVFGVKVDAAAVAEARRAAEAQRHRFLDADGGGGHGNDEQDDQGVAENGHGNGNDAGELRRRGARESRAVGRLGAAAVGDAASIECVRATKVQLAETETRVHMLLLRAQNARLQAAAGASNLSLVLASNKAASVRMTSAAVAAANGGGGVDGGSGSAATASGAASSSSSSSSLSSALSADGATYGMNAFDAFFTFADKSFDLDVDGASLMLVNDASRQVAVPLLHATVGMTRVTAAALVHRMTVLARSSAAVQVRVSQRPNG